MALIANTNCTITHGAGSTITGGVFTITTAPSVKVSASGAFVYTGTITFTFAGGSEPTVVDGTVTGGGTIAPTGTKTSVEAQFPIRQGDTGTLTGTGANPAPPPATLPVAGPVVVSVAGQTKVDAL